MGFLESFLEKVASFQKKNALVLLIAVLVFTSFIVMGIPKIEFESDMTKEMPQDLPIYVLNDKVRDSFGGQDTILILFLLDDKLDLSTAPRDIRDPSIINYLIDFESALAEETDINSAMSAGTILQNFNFTDAESVIDFSAMVPEISQFYSRDYKSTFMIVSADVGSSDKKINSLVELIEDKLAGLPPPGGLSVMISGSPPVQVTIFEILQSDAVYTLVLASAIIFLLLCVLERSIAKGIIIFMPLMFGLFWTMGTMGWIGLKISVATAGLGAMILGLGVEYGVFMYTRYHEERDKGKNQLESLKVAVPAVGSAVLGSGLTTIVGFMALTLSIMPLMQHLGQSLALGIVYCLIAAVFVEPIIIVLEENIEFYLVEKKHNAYSKKREHHRGRAR